MSRRQTEEQLLAEIRLLNEELRSLRKRTQLQEDQLKAVDEIEKLKRELVDLKIEKDRIQEQREKEKREVDHYVGLERKRQEFEIDQAKKETALEIREGNLKAEEDRFKRDMEFMKTRFEEESTYTREILTQVLDRLPTVTVDKQITQGTRRATTR